MSTHAPSPAPVPDETDLGSLPLGELRALREEMRTQEHQVSYWRRLVHGRLDLLALHRDSPLGEPAVEGITEALSSAMPSAGQARTDVHDTSPAEVIADLADLECVWHTPEDAQGAHDLAARLRVVESELSGRRAALHRSIDAATAELVSRYQQDPRQALHRDRGTTAR